MPLASMRGPYASMSASREPRRCGATSKRRWLPQHEINEPKLGETDMMKRLITAALFATMMAGTALADTTLKLVEVITSPERTETLKSIVAKLETANPGTKVEIISLPCGEACQKFATMVSAGDTPDVMEMPDTWLSLYANNGMLESLEPYLEKWEHTGDLTPRALDLGRDVKDTAYMLPYGFYLRAMFYNKKLLAEAGVKE